MTHFDAVVIGAGNGGLTAATTLQRNGCNTLLLERHNIPGGCATSFVRGEFEFEVALHQLSGIGPEDRPFIMRKLFSDLGVLDKVELVQEHELYRLIVPGRQDITLPASWTGIQKRLSETFPDEADNIRQFFDLGSKVAMEYYMGLPVVRKTNNPELLDSQCPNFKAWGLRPTDEVLAEFIHTPALINAIAPYWSYAGVPTKELVFAEFIGILFAYCTFKPWHFKGGSQSVSSAFIESFEEAGGTVRFNCGASRILTQGSRVTGVRLENGEEVSCDYVVSNASPLVTYYDLLDTPTPESVRQDFRSRRKGVSAVCVYLGLDCLPEEIGITTASTFVMSSDNADIDEARLHTLSPPEWGMVTCYNFIDEDLAPAGKSVVTLVALQYGDAWASVPPEAYADTKYRFGGQLIDLIEKAYPGIRAHIEKAEVATPLSMMRYLNTPDGAIYGFRQNIQDGPLFRDPLKGIDGLFSAGSWTAQGGFQPTYMAGHATAKTILRKLKAQQKEAAHV
ncbi:MAG: NAD(P)/FAD-dependent oxidoreductase [Gammaproteobacteria bacterium]|nr:MAG: NAD(P)/FAD-dependent oxidoreductase [Gammaproteobacteria bacterium]